MKGKRIVLPIAIACVLAAAVSFGAALSKQQAAVPENPVQGIHEDSSQVLWTGQGYKTRLALTDTQDPVTEEVLDMKMPADQKETAKEKSEEEAAGESTDKKEPSEEGTETVTYDDEGEGGESSEESEDDNENQEGAEGPGDYDESNEGDEDGEESYYPTIASDLMDGEVVNGAYRTFYVRAEDYRGKYISAGSLVTYGNGGRLYATADDGEMVKYRLDLKDGANKITIKATDKQGRSTTVSYTIYKGNEAAAEPAGSITFSLEATTVGLGYLIGPSEEVFYEGEQLSYFIDRVLQEHGYTYRYDGNLTNGFYLKHIVRTGITNGWSISEELQEKLRSVNSALGGYHANSLGEYDFTSTSGWLYFVNGAQMSSGIATYYPADGDVVRIRFSLYDGADVGQSMHGETWGDW